jgi:hypothetical protein
LAARNLKQAPLWHWATGREQGSMGQRFRRFIMADCLVSEDIVMAHAAYQPVFSTEDFLAWEPIQLDRHEFLQSEVNWPRTIAPCTS